MQTHILVQNKIHSSGVSMKKQPSTTASHTVLSKFKELCRKWDVPPKQTRKLNRTAHEHPGQKPERLEGSFYLQRHWAHYLINTLFGNTRIYSVDQERWKEEGHFQDCQGVVADLIMYLSSKCRFQMKDTIWGKRGFQIFSAEQLTPTSLE